MPLVKSHMCSFQMLPHTAASDTRHVDRARLYSSFHLIEQPIDAFWSAGATPVVAIARMASTSSRGAPRARRSCAAFVEPAAILELAVDIVTEEIRRTGRPIRPCDCLGLVVEIWKREIMSLRETLHILK